MATVNEKMTAIADAIRAKTGGTELLGLDAMAQAIAALETGGGLPENIVAIDSGIYTVASNVGTGVEIRVPHNLGVEPDAALFYYNGNFGNSGYIYAYSKMRVRVYDTSAGRFGYVTDTYAYRNSSGYIAGFADTNSQTSTAFTDVDFQIRCPLSNIGIMSGSYKWAVIKFA